MNERQELWRRGAAAIAVIGALGISVSAWADGVTRPTAGTEASVQVAQAADLATLQREGGPLFAKNCSPCHGNNGEGGAGPKLVGHDFLASAGAVIGQIFNGNEDHGMPAFRELLNDRQTAAIATYVRNAWGNKYGIVTPDEVKQSR